MGGFLPEAITVLAFAVGSLRLPTMSLVLAVVLPTCLQAQDARVTDAGLSGTDSDFAWRTGWSEAPYWGGRIGFVDAAGVLRVKLRYAPEGTPGGAWVVVAKDIADFQLLDWRLAVRRTDGSLWYAQGPLNTPLEKIDEHVGAYQMSLGEIATLSDEGVFKISGGDRARAIACGVKAFQVLHTGRIGILGNDGGLWLFEGGHAQADAFRQVASDVKSFQLEREWVAIVTNDKATTLWLAKGEPFQPLSFAPVARKTGDFEMEIEVKFTENFPGRIHLAVVNQSGKLLVGNADNPEALRVRMEKVVGNVSHVSWAGGQLAVVDPAGSLRIAERDHDGQLSIFAALGQVKEYKLGVERTLLLERPTGELMQIGPRLVADTNPGGDAAKGADAGQVTAGLDPTSEAPLFSGKQTPRVIGFELSSLRPGFGRRAATLDLQHSAEALTFLIDAESAAAR